MEQSELNKRLFDKIEFRVQWHDDIILGFDADAAANDCEKICLQSQIDLLNKVKIGLIQKGVIDEWIKELTEQLKELEK